MDMIPYLSIYYLVNDLVYLPNLTINGLPCTYRGRDSIWVIVDHLTRSSHFFPVKSTYRASQYDKLFILEIVKLHGVPSSIVSDGDHIFTSKFSKAFHKSLGTQQKISVSRHPQMDGQLEMTIKTLEDMLHACVLDDGSSWRNHLPLIEFSYNNNYHSSIWKTLYQALYS